MEIKLVKFSLFKMIILSFIAFMTKHKLEDDTMNESDLQKVHIYRIYPRNSRIISDKGFVNKDDGSQGGTHWTCFSKKDHKSYYFDSFRGQVDRLLLNQLPKPITYHNYKIQDINSKLCGSYCLYFFCLIERMKYYDAILKMCFYKPK